MAPGKTQVGADLGPQETPGPAQPVDRYRPHQSTPLHPYTADPPQSVKVGGQWSQPILAAGHPG